MFSDRNLINRHNVVTDVKKKFAACQEFFVMEVEARVVAATLHVLGLKSLDDEPTETVLPASIKGFLHKYHEMFYKRSIP